MNVVKNPQMFFLVLSTASASITETRITTHGTAENPVPLQKIWPLYKNSEKHHKWDIYMP
jgi:hypothetical protein